jgi:hypothetical protein
MYSPSLDEFLKLAAQGNLIPVTRRILADSPLDSLSRQNRLGQVSLYLRRQIFYS